MSDLTNRKNVVIFDLDGTLLNTLGDLAASINYALERAGFATRSIEEVCAFVGNGVRMLITRSVPEGTNQTVQDQMYADYTDYYRGHWTDRTTVYPHIEQMLSALKERGFLLAVVSNKDDDAVKALCRHYFGDMIAVAVGNQEGYRRKPDPDLVQLALKTLGASKEQAVYVGDSEVDVATAANTGLPCISACWGFRTKKQLLSGGASFLAEDPMDIIAILETQLFLPQAAIE